MEKWWQIRTVSVAVIDVTKAQGALRGLIRGFGLKRGYLNTVATIPITL
jgi:hypothetical protein